jgi:hypothetical protein
MSDTPNPPSVNDLLRTIARRDRLVVGDGATSSDVSAGLRHVRDDRDVGQPGLRRLVRSDKVTISDLIRQLRDAAADDRTPDTLEDDQ